MYENLACLAASNAPWAPTGYGTQIKQLATRMLSDGINVAIASNYGLEGTTIEWQGITVLPRGYDQYSSDVIGAYAKDFAAQNADRSTFLLTLYDTWVYLGHPTWEAIDVPIVSWVPIDHRPIPPKVLQWCQRANVTPVAMSRFGSEELTRSGVEHVCIPHGIDMGVYRPTEQITDGSGKPVTGRDIMRVPDDAHVTALVNANKGSYPVRKAWAENLAAWATFARDKPDAWLYIHSEMHGALGGVPLQPILDSVGAPMDRVRFVNQYHLRMGLPDDAMAAIYTGAAQRGVLLAATLGEGFGLTVAEAGACGLRAIVSDFTAQPELVADGWKVPGQALWDPAQSSYFATPSIPGIIRALEQSYEITGPSQVSRDHIRAHYDADTLYATGWRDLWKVLAA